MSSDASMPFGEHLEELRKRLFWAVGGIVPILAVSLYFGPQLLGFLIHPVQVKLRQAGQSPTLQSTGPLETFTTYLQVSVIATLLVGAPWVLWNLWRFVAPGLYSHERRFVYVLLPMSVLLTISGTVFLYKVVLPLTLFFLINFGSDVGKPDIPESAPPPGIVMPLFPSLPADPPEPRPGEAWINSELMQLRVAVPKPDGSIVIWATALTEGAGIQQNYRVAEYVKLFLAMAVAFAAAFQLPVVVLLLGWVGIVDAEMLGRYRKHAVLGCAVIAALLTPGDPTQMILLGVPLWLLYELGIVLLRVLPATRVRGQTSDDDGERPSRVRRAPVRGIGKAARAVLPPPKPAEPPDAGDE